MMGAVPLPDELQPGDRLLQPGQGLRPNSAVLPGRPPPGWQPRPAPPQQRPRSGRWPLCRSAVPPWPPPRIRGGSFSPRRTYRGANPLGGVDLVSAHGQQVHPLLHAGVKGTFRKPCTPSQWDEGGAAQPSDQLSGLGHRQHGTQLVVHQHHGHQRRVQPQGRLQLLQRGCFPPRSGRR